MSYDDDKARCGRCGRYARHVSVDLSEGSSETETLECATHGQWTEGY